MDKAIETVKDMIQQRGYLISEEDDEKFIGVDENKQSIVVFTTLVDKFNVDRIKEKVAILNSINANHCIVIYGNSVTSMAKKLVENSVEKKFELFTQDELQYNITKHRLVPKHIKLNNEDAKDFKKKYGLKFPALLKTDPVCRFYDFQRGDVIKIIRQESCGNTYITHRIVKG